MYRSRKRTLQGLNFTMQILRVAHFLVHICRMLFLLKQKLLESHITGANLVRANFRGAKLSGVEGYRVQ
ncbi:hypothetical protein ACLB2K_021482 [Fragaria x ananassa]